MNILTTYQYNDSCRFCTWAPLKQSMQLHIVFPEEKRVDMLKDDLGYFTVLLEDAVPGTKYFFSPDHQQDIPDPASQYQPEGVHGPSEVIDHRKFQWTDIAWKGLPLQELVIYELHPGTFTTAGNFDAAIERLDDLADTGINAIELMPVIACPGNRNWGYDGVYPFAVHQAYGGPDALKRFVNTCHEKGIAVILDVVYNHIGPEGNYFELYGPYFTDKYSTPWGRALNLDREWSDGVRNFILENIRYWFEYFHIDGLRIDAVHEMYDTGAVNFWEQVSHNVQQMQQQQGRPLYMIAESDLNSPRVIQSPDTGGWGFNVQWLDDFHHALYVLLYRKGREQYVDFNRIEQLAKAFKDGFVHTGEYVQFRKRNYGTSSAGVPGDRFIVFYNNHDQAGNRPDGKKLCSLVDFERLKLAAAVMLTAPYIPMIFMGDEYGDPAPFFYFTDHGDETLINDMRKGRKVAFNENGWREEPRDPQDEQTFLQSKLQWSLRTEGKHHLLLQWHKALLGLRRTHAVMKHFNKSNLQTYTAGQHLLAVHRRTDDGRQHLLSVFNFSEQTQGFSLPEWTGPWNKLLHSKDLKWMDTTVEPEDDGLELLVSPGSTVLIHPLSVRIYECKYCGR